ncbi:hypothetical protein MAC_07058 [Metarhizium acridum CQMa 102]|uniref:Uncharacterized protein n=1 Tax=Metarhizium acridum (strain CQMa 102) TaxID=655827 RepID=E9EB10_METAQ|nr:uncharacterized protein MAC_07058 [Metarhizium acridum CQMa 102]EFY86941.1 hypothetical protein MAC_07058 [Metarhizium acridum CQMa 102]
MAAENAPRQHPQSVRLTVHFTLNKKSGKILGKGVYSTNPEEMISQARGILAGVLSKGSVENLNFEIEEVGLKGDGVYFYNIKENGLPSLEYDIDEVVFLVTSHSIISQ